MILGFLFIAPMLGAWLLYHSHWQSDQKTLNHGELINPPLELSQLNLLNPDGQDFNQSKLRGKWLMLYVSAGMRDAQLEQNLYKMRQIRTATGKDMNRIQCVLLSFKQQDQSEETNQSFTTDYASILHLITSPTLALPSTSLYLVDPLGNVMMRYNSDTPLAHIFKDLTRLLKISQIG